MVHITKLSLLVAIISISLINCDGELPELTPFEKDKYLSCKELVFMLLNHDEEIVSSTLTQEGFLLNGIRVLIYVNMMKNCVWNIDDELVRLIYLDGKRVVKMKGIDDEKLAFIKVNYTDYKDLQSFLLDDQQTMVLKHINALTPNTKNPFGDYFTEEAMNKRIEAQIERIKNRKNGTTERTERTEALGEELQTNNTGMSFEEEFNVTTIQEAKYVIDLNEIFDGLFDKEDNSTESSIAENNPLDNNAKDNDITDHLNNNSFAKEETKETLNDTEKKSEL